MLLYPGRTHSIHGESESGKSMVAMVEVARLVMEGGRACYIDYENGADTILERLVLMGCTPAALRRGLAIVRPESDPSANDMEKAAYKALLAQRFDLIVIDSVNEALILSPVRQRSTAGLGGNDDITAWHKRVPARLARETGAAVVVIDHVAKGENGQGRFAIGGQAKMAAISGAAFVVRPVDPIGVGLVGKLDLLLGKDRSGRLRGIAGAGFDKTTRLQAIAQVVLDGTGDRISAAINPPGRTAAPEERARRVREQVAGLLHELPEGHEGLTTRTIRSELGGRPADIGDALNWLVAKGFLSKKVKGQGHLYLMAKPYIEDFS